MEHATVTLRIPNGDGAMAISQPVRSARLAELADVFRNDPIGTTRYIAQHLEAALETAMKAAQQKKGAV